MLRDRSQPVDLFALVPALELRFEPELAELDQLLEDDQIFQQIKTDLSRRRPHTTETGRPSTPVEVILRLLVVQHLYDWSYAQTEHFVGDSLVLRQFCRLGFEPVPHHTTLMRWSNLLQPETMHCLLDRVTELARSLKVKRWLAGWSHETAQQLASAIQRTAPLVQQVIAQTERRVLHGESVPASAKLVSLFEPHTAIVRRGKAHLPAEFGRKIMLDEVDGGLVTRYAVLVGNPPDAPELPTSLMHHQACFTQVPDVLTADRAFFTLDND